MSRHNGLAATPPMGWNSYLAFGITVREAEVRANARYMADHLRPYGWEYVVVDGMWYQDTGPLAGEPPWTPVFVHPLQYNEIRAQYNEPRIEPLPLRFDGYGRLLPDLHKFPSAAGDAGFRPLADYVHGLGLKFGLHLMRGIPRQVVEGNYPILGTPYRARDVAVLDDVCGWWQGMCGLRLDHPGAQAYYDSLAALYASWGVDFVKADDMGVPAYQAGHVASLARALAGCGRPILLNVSTGRAADTTYAEHRKAYCEMWRIGPDLHDEWPQVRDTFEFLPRWRPHAGPGHWPDPDMLPFGLVHLREWEASKGHPRLTKLSHDEQVTAMTLWCVSRAPLFVAGDLPANDDWTRQLLTNPEVLAVNQRGVGGHEAWRFGETRVWAATAPDGRSRIVACFQLADAPGAPIPLPFAELALPARCAVRDLWARCDLGAHTTDFAAATPPHGARLLQLTPAD